MSRLFRKNSSGFWLLPSTFVLMIFLSQSCISTKSVTYFSNLPDSAKIQLDDLKPPPFVVQINDVLQINIGGENEKTVQYINQYYTGGTGLQAVVDVNGEIELPKVGKFKVAGLSKEAVRDTLVNAYKEYLVDPVVNVTFGNFRFSVLGEVRGAGTFDVQGEKVNIFEALTKAGDLTQYAIRDDVKIIRDVNWKREIISVNLNDKNILNSPSYYLNRYDILYVKSRDIKLLTENVQRTVAYIGAASGILALLLSVIK